MIPPVRIRIVGHDDSYRSCILEMLEMELLDLCFVKGTGLTFIDQILSSQQSVDGIGNTNGNDNGNAEGILVKVISN